MEYQYTITIQDIYRTSDIASKVPANKVILGFRPPKKGEVFLSASTFELGLLLTATYDWKPEHPRLIVGPKTKKVLVGEWEIVDNNDPIRTSTGYMSENSSQFYLKNFSDIYRVEERSVE